MTRKYKHLFISGLDPEHPFDLGAEIEIYMGEEIEKYTYNRSRHPRRFGTSPMANFESRLAVPDA